MGSQLPCVPSSPLSGFRSHGSPGLLPAPIGWPCRPTVYCPLSPGLPLLGEDGTYLGSGPDGQERRWGKVLMEACGVWKSKVSPLTPGQGHMLALTGTNCHFSGLEDLGDFTFSSILTQIPTACLRHSPLSRLWAGHRSQPLVPCPLFSHLLCPWLEGTECLYVL